MYRTALMLLGILLVCSACFGQCSVVVGKGASPLEDQAAGEVMKYIYAATGKLLPITNSATGDAIAVGTPASNPLVRKFISGAKGLGDEGYLLRTVKDGKRRVLIVTGNTPNGVLYGAYALAEEYGCGFYLGGDAIPARKPFKLLDLDITRKPSFKVRGTLPWYNFFDSPTTWDYQDYCWFFDNLIKTKNNFIGFHSYDYEPFCAYKEDGKYVYGEPVATTETPTWGTHSMKCSEFGFGTGKYFPDEYFGSKPGLYRNDRERSIKDSQDLLKKALDYAHHRGLKTCLGFEVSGADPTDPAAVEVLEKRLKHLVTQYPMLDYVWIWEIEAVGLNGINPPAPDSRLGSYYRRWEPVFSDIEDPRRKAEAVRLALYTNEAYRILKQIAPEKRLILSGWGGDHHLKCSDFYPGLDKVVPKDVIFSALDNIITSPKVSEGYGKLSPERERWPIPWFEYDGDQWHPQPNADTWLNACKDSIAKGSQGILGIHWRTRDVEESHAMMSQFAWEPKLTFEQFYARYAKKQYGEKHAEEMAKIHMELQALGYRWLGGSGQTECGGFGWGSPVDPEKVKKLEAILPKVQDVWGALLGTPGQSRQAANARYLVDTIAWVLQYEKTAQSLLPDGEVTKLLLKARAERAAGRDDHASRTATEGLYRLRACNFGAALHICAHRSTDKGSMGILATVNAKAYSSYRAVEDELAPFYDGKSKDIPVPASYLALPPNPFTPEPVPFHPINPSPTWCRGVDLPVGAIFDVPTPCLCTDYSVCLRYRHTGVQDERCLRVSGNHSGSHHWLLPASELSGRDIEYMLELSCNAPNQITDSYKVVSTWPGNGMWHQVLLLPPVPESRPKPAPKVIAAKISGVTVKPGEGCALVVEWKGPLARYEVSRSEQGGLSKVIATVTDTWFEDRDVKPATSYRYIIKPVGGMAVSSASIKAPGTESMPAPVVSATPKRGKVWLKWPKAVLGIAGYRIYTAPSARGPWARVPEPDQVAANWYADHLQVVRAEPGTATHYRVAPVDRFGNEGEASQPVECSALPLGGMKPVLAEDFLPEGPEGRITGGQPLLKTLNGAQVAYFQKGDYIAYANRPEFNPDMELSLMMWVKLESPGVMPVMLGHGLWSLDGYFLQTFNSTVRFNLEGVGTLDAGHIEPGKWYHIGATYDGIAMKVYLNGKEVGSKPASGAPKPSPRTLWIGRYEYPDDQYATDSQIAAVRIYTIGLTAEEIAAEYRRLADALR